MSPSDTISMRRAILDWRDTHCQASENHLSRELNVLFAALDAEIDKMEYTDILFNGAEYSKTHLQPQYTEWVEREVKEIDENARNDLLRTYQTLTVHFNIDSGELEYHGNSTCGKEVTTIALAGAGALAAIPTVASWSVVSAGGLAGFFGITVISWPVVVAGLAIGGLFFALSGAKVASLKAKVCDSLKKDIRKSIRAQVLGSENGSSIREKLHDHFCQMADAILKEIPA